MVKIKPVIIKEIPAFGRIGIKKNPGKRMRNPTPKYLPLIVSGLP